MTNRGRWYRWDKKATVDDYLALDMADLAKIADLSGIGQQRRYVATLHLRAGSEVRGIDVWAIPGEGLMFEYPYGGEYSNEVIGDIVPVVTTRPHYGGVRYWLCPNQDCRRRVRILYGGKHFLCRRCRDLTYAVCQQAKVEARCTAIQNRMRRIRRRLKAAGGVQDMLSYKPPGMHEMTYLRLIREYEELELRACNAMAPAVDRMVGAKRVRPAAGVPVRQPGEQERSEQADPDAFWAQLAARHPELIPWLEEWLEDELADVGQAGA